MIIAYVSVSCKADEIGNRLGAWHAKTLLLNNTETEVFSGGLRAHKRSFFSKNNRALSRYGEPNNQLNVLYNFRN